MPSCRQCDVSLAVETRQGLQVIRNKKENRFGDFHPPARSGTTSDGPAIQLDPMPGFLLPKQRLKPRRKGVQLAAQ